MQELHPTQDICALGRGAACKQGRCLTLSACAVYLDTHFKGCLVLFEILALTCFLKADHSEMARCFFLLYSLESQSHCSHSSNVTFPFTVCLQSQETMVH